MIIQSGNHVGEDLVARDKYANSYVFNSPLVIGNNELHALYAKLKSTDPTEESTKAFCEKLQHYLTSNTDGDVRGLEAKLAESHRQDQLPIAKAMKESAYKAIMRQQTSGTAQRIYTIVMDELHTNFMLTATPIIQDGGDRTAVDQAILKVLADTENILGENLLQITKKDLLSLIYFLGGNCHLRWDKC